MDKNILFSISSKPGKFGFTLYNYLFKKYSLPFIYKPVAIKEENTFKKILYLLEMSEMFYGLSISMPFKKVAFEYFKNKKNFHLLQKNVFSLNSLKKNESCIIGALTDYFIFEDFRKILDENIKYIFIFGNGAMANLANQFFRDNSYKCYIFSRGKFSELREMMNDKSNFALINATPLILEKYFSLDSTNFPILDLPVRIGINESNPLLYSGFRATKIQFKHQFHFYFGIDLELNEINSDCKRLFENI